MSADCSRLKPGNSPVLDEALSRRQAYYESQNAMPRCMMLGIVCAAALTDANCGLIISLIGAKQAVPGLLLYMLEMLIFALSLTSLLGYMWRYLYPMYSSPLLLSDTQFKLLSLDKDTPGFARSPEREEKYPNPFSPLPGSLICPPKQSPPSPAQSSTTPVNSTYNSWMSSSPVSKLSPCNASGASMSSLNTSTNQRRDHYSGYDSPITNQNELSQYLDDYSAWENTSFNQDKMDDSGSVASQSIFYWRGGSKPDISQYRRTEYMLSTPPSKTSSSSTDSPADKAKTEVLSQRLGVDPMRLVSWNENLRIWMTQTILKPLVSEIDNINNNLPKQGVSDAKIGESPVDRLRKLSSLPQVAANLPTLPALIPFLEVSQDQEYIVSRIKELSSTGALSLYRWDAGGRRPGQPQQVGAWTEKLPSDSELVLHLVTTYLDSRLVASSATRLTDSREGMPFTHSHFFKLGEKIDKTDKDFLAIVQVKSRPPHYVVQVGDKQLDVGGGRNNLLHTLLLFLHQVKEERDGMIGRVNLGLSGLNILWVLD